MPFVPRTSVKSRAGQLFAGQGLHSGTQSCFHNAAGGAEDHGRAGAQSQRRVKALVRQIRNLMPTLRIMRASSLVVME